jgi:DNA replication protein
MSASPIRMTYTPIPNTFLGPLLSDIGDLAELKCALRIFWHLNHVKGSLKTIPIEELSRDPVILAALKDPKEPNESSQKSNIGDVSKALVLEIQSLVSKGIFVVLSTSHEENGKEVVALSTPQNLAKGKALGLCEIQIGRFERLEDHHSGVERHTIFHLYEANIGLLTPIIAEELKEAEIIYPEHWISEAFVEAVERNKRNWKYITRILERWAQEGKDDGKFGGHTETIGAGEYIRRYGAPWRR